MPCVAQAVQSPQCEKQRSIHTFARKVSEDQSLQTRKRKTQYAPFVKGCRIDRYSSHLNAFATHISYSKRKTKKIGKCKMMNCTIIIHSDEILCAKKVGWLDIQPPHLDIYQNSTQFPHHGIYSYSYIGPWKH